ncbi:MAG: NAD-dependent epimerase [Sphingomonadales bacterium]|nr:NAD-dependent epimerase [Sphingomonadales bacterium]
MVVGNGLVARAFSAYQEDVDKLIFASGVSNSSFTNHQEADREYELLYTYLKKYPDLQLIYFSTASVYDPSLQDSFYIRHKLNIENYIKENASKYLIIRASNIVGGGTNPNTLVNRFIHQFSTNETIDVWRHATRNLIGLDDFYLIVDSLIKKQLYTNSIVNVANPISNTVFQVVDAIANFMQVVPNIRILDRGTSYFINVTTILPLIHKLELCFTADYLDSLLKRYYS